MRAASLARCPPITAASRRLGIGAFGAVLAGIANPGHAIRAIKGLHTWRSSLLLELTSLPITTAALGSGRRRFFLTNRWREVVLCRLSVADGCLKYSKVCA
jgi:hypothetical protein